MTYSQLFLNSRGKIPPENHCFRTVFELRHSFECLGRRRLPQRMYNTPRRLLLAASISSWI